MSHLTSSRLPIYTTASVSATSDMATLMPLPLFHGKTSIRQNIRIPSDNRRVTGEYRRPTHTGAGRAPFPRYDDDYAVGLLEAQRHSEAYHSQPRLAAPNTTAPRTQAAISAPIAPAPEPQCRDSDVLSRIASDRSNERTIPSNASPATYFCDANGMYHAASQAILQTMHGFPYHVGGPHGRQGQDGCSLRSPTGSASVTSVTSLSKHSAKATVPPVMLHTLHGFPYIEAVIGDGSGDGNPRQAMPHRTQGYPASPCFPKQRSGTACCRGVKCLIYRVLPAQYGVREIKSSMRARA